jgi:hypothetical protein
LRLHLAEQPRRIRERTVWVFFRFVVLAGFVQIPASD